MNHGEIREAAMFVSPSGSREQRERPGMGLYAKLHETLDSLDSRPLFDIPAAVAAFDGLQIAHSSKIVVRRDQGRTTIRSGSVNRVHHLMKIFGASDDGDGASFASRGPHSIAAQAWLVRNALIRQDRLSCGPKYG